jgi:hypothetical protein
MTAGRRTLFKKARIAAVLAPGDPEPFIAQFVRLPTHDPR